MDHWSTLSTQKGTVMSADPSEELNATPTPHTERVRAPVPPVQHPTSCAEATFWLRLLKWHPSGVPGRVVQPVGAVPCVRGSSCPYKAIGGKLSNAVLPGLENHQEVGDDLRGQLLHGSESWQAMRRTGNTMEMSAFHTSARACTSRDARCDLSLMMTSRPVASAWRSATALRA